MKRIFYLLFACLMATSMLHAQGQASIIKEISNAAENLQTLQCNFVQTKQMKLLGDKMVSKGKMYYAQSSKLRWEYTSPYRYTFIMNSSKVSLTKGVTNTVIDVQKNKVFKEIANIMLSSMVGKCLTDTKSFKTTAKTGQAEYVVTLVPVKKDLKQMYSQIVLHYSRSQRVVTKVEMKERSGDTTAIQLSGIIKNKSINANTFVIK